MHYYIETCQHVYIRTTLGTLPSNRGLGRRAPRSICTGVISSCHPSCPIHPFWASRSLLEYLYAHNAIVVERWKVHHVNHYGVCWLWVRTFTLLTVSKAKTSISKYFLSWNLQCLKSVANIDWFVVFCTSAQWQKELSMLLNPAAKNLNTFCALFNQICPDMQWHVVFITHS